VGEQRRSVLYRSSTGERMFAVAVITHPALKVERPVSSSGAVLHFSGGSLTTIRCHA
jgi:hypothetical protein